MRQPHQAQQPENQVGDSKQADRQNRTSRQPAPRRLGPRPLPLHLGLTCASWSNSALVLPSLKFVWQHLKEQDAANRGTAPEKSNPGAPETASRPAALNKPKLPIPPALADALRHLGPQIDSADPAALAKALDDEGHRRFDGFLTGVLAYRRDGRDLPGRARPVLWREGTTRLLDYRQRQGKDAAATAPRLLVIPSLVNRYHILDLDPSISFLDHLARTGLQPFVVDWDAPGETERNFSLTDYIDRLERAYDAVRQQPGGPVIVLGYCMGGLLALALAQICQTGNGGGRQQQLSRDLAGLVLLATPWDFHADQAGHAQAVAEIGRQLEPVLQALGELPVDLLQYFFALLDPFLVPRKFQSFAALDRSKDTEQAAAQRFVVLEDWINDGVPLAAQVARECLVDWYGGNVTKRNNWRVGGNIIDPVKLHLPSLVMVPSNDRIVPPGSALALGRALNGSTIETPAAGHIGMMVGTRAPRDIWPRVTAWIESVATGGKKAARPAR
ncbi:MAG: alpha/beta fold hydrolase [Dongiaceae bacterium]